MYQILEKDRVKYISLVVLNEIVQFQHYFPVKLTGDDVYLDAYLKGMLTKGLLRIEKSKYVPTDAGRQEIVKLYERYTDYLKMYDVFCAVDLSTGEFAFKSMVDYGDGDTEQQIWGAFLTQERFSDVRVAIVDFKGLNPTEIVFMSFLQEGRFTCETPRWQHELTGADVWAEIEEICNTAISSDYLKSEGVIEDVIIKGTKVALNLIKLAEEANTATQPGDEMVEETTITEEIEEYVDPVVMPTYPYSYWDSYYCDPFYVSPLWLPAAVLIW